MSLTKIIAKSYHFFLTKRRRLNVKAIPRGKFIAIECLDAVGKRRKECEVQTSLRLVSVAVSNKQLRRTRDCSTANASEQDRNISILRSDPNYHKNRHRSYTHFNNGKRCESPANPTSTNHGPNTSYWKQNNSLAEEINALGNKSTTRR